MASSREAADPEERASDARMPCPLCGGDDDDLLFVRAGQYRHVRCRGCRLLYVNPPPPDVRSHNDRIYGETRAGLGGALEALRKLDPAALAAEAERGRRRPPSRYRRELEALEPYRKDGRLLDVGCGEGRFLLAAEGRGWEVAGVELVEANAALCRTAFGLDVRTGFLHDAAFEPAAFDAVRLNQVIEHVPDPLGLLRDIRRVVRPGGALSLATPNVDSYTYAVLGERWRYLGDDANGHLVFFSPRTLSRALRETGFRPVRWRTKSVRLAAGERGVLVGLLERAAGQVAKVTGRGSRMHVLAEAVP